MRTLVSYQILGTGFLPYTLSLLCQKIMDTRWGSETLPGPQTSGPQLLP